MLDLPKKMYAGLFEGRVYASTEGGSDYTPLGVALFKTRAEAQRRFEHVIEVDPSALLTPPDLQKSKRK